MNLHIDDILADKITVENILNMLHSNRKLADKLLAKDSLEAFEACNLANNLKLIKHFEAVLSFFMSSDDYELRVGKKSGQE